MATLTDVLAEHRLLISDFISVIGTCEGCEWRKSGFRRDAIEEAHREHVENMLAPVIEAAKAEAVREALAEVEVRIEDSAGSLSPLVSESQRAYATALYAVREVRAARGGES